MAHWPAVRRYAVGDRVQMRGKPCTAGTVAWTDEHGHHGHACVLADEPFGDDYRRYYAGNGALEPAGAAPTKSATNIPENIPSPTDL